MIIAFDKDKIGESVPEGHTLCIYNYGETLRVILAKSLSNDKCNVVNTRPEVFIKSHKNIVFDETFSYDIDWKIRFSLSNDKIKDNILQSICDNSRPLTPVNNIKRIIISTIATAINVIIILYFIYFISAVTTSNNYYYTNNIFENPLDIIDTISDNKVLPLTEGKYILYEYRNKGKDIYKKEIYINRINKRMLFCDEDRYWLWYDSKGLSIMNNGGVEIYKVFDYRLQNCENPNIYVTKYHIP